MRRADKGGLDLVDVVVIAGRERHHDAAVFLGGVVCDAAGEHLTVGNADVLAVYADKAGVDDSDFAHCALKSGNRNIVADLIGL